MAGARLAMEIRGKAGGEGPIGGRALPTPLQKCGGGRIEPLGEWRCAALLHLAAIAPPDAAVDEVAVEFGA